MKLSIYLGGLSAFAIPLASCKQHTGGSGPYPATYFAEPTLSNHTIYLPSTPTRNESLPVLIWGEGGCENNGTRFANFLTNVASYGFVVLASGPPQGASGTTSWEMMADAASWITAKAGSGRYAAVDASKIAVAGQSCGGLEAYKMRSDDRVSFLGIFNSGFLKEAPAPGGPVVPDVESPEAISEVHKPVFYFIGGPTDIAYANGERDYQALEDVPKWIGNYPSGHGGTYDQVDGGAYGVAAVKWLQWTLKGNSAAAGFFTTGGAENAGWETESSDLEGLWSYIH
ncbi:Alpha/Beta hydrolase protein [Aspergillus floccosus]